LEVFDEEDEEVKKHTHEKNIVEIIVEKEDNLHLLEKHLLALMELPLAFLKQCKLISPNTKAQFINQMTLLTMMEDMNKRLAEGTFTQEMTSPVYTRNSVLMSLIHAKKLLL